MNTASTHSIIPEGEMPCVWMDAGVVEYKLCDRRLQCDGCPFDERIRAGQLSAVAPSGEERPDAGEVSTAPDTAEKLFAHALENRLAVLKDVLPPREVRLHRNHFWVAQQLTPALRFGIDHIAGALLRPIIGIVTPRPPLAVAVHDPMCWIVAGYGTITVPAPVAGTIRSFNPLLSTKPSVVDSDPYGNGWLLEFLPHSAYRVAGEFISAPSHSALVEKQLKAVARIFTEAFSQRHANVGVTLYDGGTRIPDLETILGTPVYSELAQSLFRIPL